MGVGHEDAICEDIEFMQIPPRFERRRAAYKCVAGILQYDAKNELRVQDTNAREQKEVQPAFSRA